MADTEVVVEGAEGAAAKEGEQAPQYSEQEERAIAQGWVPKDQWDGAGKWRDAEEFLDRGELFAKIDEKERRLRSLENTQNALKQHLETVRRTEYDRAYKVLKAERKEALAEGDVDKVVEVEDRIENFKTHVAQQEAIARQQTAEPQANPVLQVWINKNPWYTSEKAMKIFADQMGHELAIQGLSDPKELLLEVERRVKKEFAHKFNNPNRNKPGTVESGGAQGSQGKRESFQLTDEETRVMNRFVKAGVLTKEEYIADIKASRGA